MPSLRLVDVDFIHPAAHALPERPLFDRLSLAFPLGWTAVVGPNGAGKTTLLRLLSGELAPSRGRVENPPDFCVAHCRQAPDSVPPSVEDFAERWDADARRARARWRLTPDVLARWSTLSQGERKRWQVAAAMGTDADALLLDEPTNHLDLEARQQLVAMLTEFRGVGVVVAHDRAFLNALAPRTVWIEAGRARLFDASVDDVREQRASEHESRHREHAERRKELKRIEAESQARRATLARAEASRSSRRRMKSARDADGRSVNRKARADNAAASHARRVAQMERRSSTAADALAQVRVDVTVGGAMSFDTLPGRAVRLSGGPTPLVFDKDARIWVAGPNGAGKSTLMRAWVDAWPDDAMLALPQQMHASARLAVRDRILAMPPDQRGRTLSRLAALGVPPKQAMTSPCPSPGEGRKMALAEGLSRGVRWLLLDEPTHHLDLPSVHRLQAALTAYRGGLVLVTHDRSLAAACTNEVWQVRDGVLQRQRPRANCSM